VLGVGVVTEGLMRRGGGLRMAHGEKKAQVRAGYRRLCPWLHLVGAMVHKGGGGGRGAGGRRGGGTGDSCEASLRRMMLTCVNV